MGTPHGVPPFTGGLHCGRCLTRTTAAVHGAPAVHRRAPLRLLRPERQRHAVDVLPPVTGGLHCGMTLPRPDRRCSRRHGGLHCGDVRMVPCRQVSRRPAGSIAARRRSTSAGAERSRRSTAGSIAATPRSAWRQTRGAPAVHGGLHCGARARSPAPDASACSRRSTAGSIAARTGPHDCQRAPGAPAVRRRAPLRHESVSMPRSCGVLPPFDGGLHCGTTLRDLIGRQLGAPAVQRRAPLRLLPQSRSRRAGRCSRRSTAGSIAASAARSLVGRGVTGAPAVRGGLHCGCRCSSPGAQDGLMLPPINGGLHCGRERYRSRATCTPVLPPSSGGLHCGSRPAERPTVGQPRAPAVQRRAPLRLAPIRTVSFRAVLPPINGGLHCCTRPAGDDVRGVLPPFTGGLHCGPPRSADALVIHRHAPADHRRAPLRATR